MPLQVRNAIEFVPDQGVDLDGGNVVQSLDSSLDLGLGGQHVSDEGQGVVLLNLLHGRLSGARRANHAELIQLGAAGKRDALVLRVASQDQGLRAVEVHRGADLAGLLGNNALLHSLGGGLGLRDGVRGS